MNSSAWNLYHPLVPVCFLTLVLIMTMMVQYPPLTVMSFVCAVAYSFVVAGPTSTCKLLAWQVPLILLIAVANLLFSAAGSTELLRVGHRAFYLEALAYGFTMGCMLAAVMMWFSNGNRMLKSDQVLLLGSKVFPTVSLMLSMTLRLIPQFLRRGSQVRDAQVACTAAKRSVFTHAGQKLRKRRSFTAVDNASRQASVLMGWGMEDSLDTADAMLARGWGCGASRSFYETRSLRLTDGVLLAVILLLGLMSIVCALALQTSFNFYPVVSGWGSWWMLIPAAILMFIPFFLEGREYLVWR